MTAPAYLTLDGARANTAHLSVPPSGCWMARVELDGDVLPTGRATIQIGALTLVGTVLPLLSDVWSGRVRVCVVAGAGGWSRDLEARSYHDDGGVQRALVLAALARDTGETIDTAGDKTRLGVDVVRLRETAARALEGVLGGAPWRVDYDGVTRYGARPAASVAGDAELLDVSTSRVMTFAAADPSSVPIGAVVRDRRMAAPLVVQQLEVEVGSAASRIHAWGIAA